AIRSLDDYVKLAGILDPEGFTSFLSMYVDADDRNSSMNTLYVSQSGLSLGEKDYYENTSQKIADIRREFVAHVGRMFQLLGHTSGEADAMAAKVMDFETRIARIQMSRKEMRDPVKVYNKRRYEELKKLLPVFDWDGFTGGNGLRSDTVVVRQIEYLKGLNDILRDTPVEVLKLHATYHFAASMGGYLPKAFQEENF